MRRRSSKNPRQRRATKAPVHQEVLMATPTSFQLYTYTGTLVLNNASQQALLQQRGADGSVIQTLMMLDSSPVGNFDPTEVTAAWQYFSNKQGVNPGDTITVYGFWNYPPGSNQPVLHVVRA